jgi:hypothetical protein
LPNVNLIAVIVAAVVNMVVGSLWYSKMMFANQWMKLTGKSMANMKGANQAMVMMAVVSLVEAYILAVVISAFGAIDLLGGAKVGFWIWLGFVVTTRASDILFEKRPAKLYQINVGYELVAFILMGAVIAFVH